MSVAESISARVSALTAAAPEAPAPATESASAPDPAGSPPTGESGSESAPDAGVSDTPGDPSGATTPSPAAKHDLLAEKLAMVRERRAAERLEANARARAAQAKRAADADRAAAAEERQRWEALKVGNFKEAISAMGRNPAEVFAEMQREAEEAGTPAGQLRQMQAAFDRQMAEAKAKIDALEKDRQEARATAGEAKFASDFQRVVAHADFAPLLVEYEPATVLNIAKSLRDDPARMHTHARRLGIRLTDPSGGYNMLDICRVLAAQQAEHERGKEQRRARLAPTPPPPAPTPAPSAKTVNGTAEPRKAGTTLGNDLASSRATSVRSRTSRHERIRKLAEELG